MALLIFPLTKKERTSTAGCWPVFLSVSLFFWQSTRRPARFDAELPA